MRKRYFAPGSPVVSISAMQEISERSKQIARKTFVWCAVLSLVGFAACWHEGEAHDQFQAQRTPLGRRSVEFPNAHLLIEGQSGDVIDSSEDVTLPAPDLHAANGSANDLIGNGKVVVAVGPYATLYRTDPVPVAVPPDDGESPRLRCTLFGHQLVLSWPLEASGFILEETADLEVPSWQPTLEPVVKTGSEHTVTVSPDGFRFFRLHRPLVERTPSEVSR